MRNFKIIGIYFYLRSVQLDVEIGGLKTEIERLEKPEEFYKAIPLIPQEIEMREVSMTMGRDFCVLKLD